ncbi:MAG: hypothetical protein AB7R55_01500 [Gemmatimonadales bacterium]
MSDTTPAARAVLTEVRRGMRPADRLREAIALSEAMRQSALDRLRAAHPQLSEREVVRLLVQERHGISLPPPAP